MPRLNRRNRRVHQPDRFLERPIPTEPTRRHRTDLGFKIRHYRKWPLILPTILVAALVVQLNVGSGSQPESPLSKPNGDPTPGAESGATGHTFGQEPAIEQRASMKDGYRVVVLEQPGGLELAEPGATVEIVTISGTPSDGIATRQGVVVAVALTSSAIVVDRSEHTASVAVSEAVALRILESQTFGSIALLAVGE